MFISSIQRYCKRKHWKGFRPIQQMAFDAYAQTKDHLVISAGTASGKTEAAMFPVLSDVKPNGTLQVIIVCPFKALLQDQVARYQQYLEGSNIQVFSWSSDTSSVHKQAWLESNTEVLVITPESLNALLFKHFKQVDTSHVFAVVVDELHTILYNERGAQTALALSYLNLFSTCRVIGISATISSSKDVISWFNTFTSIPIKFISDDANKPRYKYYLGVFQHDPLENSISVLKGNRTLIFVDSRADSEKILKYIKDHLDISAGIYYSTLSKSVREQTLQTFAQSSSSVIVTTSALEVGLDLPDVTQVIQIGAPRSIESLIQRIGRAGRRTSEIHFMILVESNPLNWELFSACAMIWNHFVLHAPGPSQFKEFYHSRCIHFILCLLAYKPFTIGQLWLQLKKLSYFSSVQKQDLVIYIQALSHNGYISANSSKHFELTFKGMTHVDSLSFYTTFRTKGSWRVICSGQEIGIIDLCPRVGQYFLLNGSQKVIEIDELTRTVYTVRESGRPSQIYSGSSDWVSINLVEAYTQISQTKRKINMSQDAWKQYLLVSDIWNTLPHYVYIPEVESIILPVDTRTLWSVKIILALYGTQASVFSCGLKLKASAINKLYRLEDIDHEDALNHIATLHLQTGGKYDEMLPTEYLIAIYTSERIDLDSALEVISKIKSNLK